MINPNTLLPHVAYQKFTFSLFVIAVLIIVAINDVNASAASPDVTVFNAAEHGVKANGKDATLAVAKLLEKAKKQQIKKIVFEKGTYHFYPEKAHEAYTFISNNDEGLKRVVFPLFGHENLEIDGQGAEFIFHGTVNPFILQDAKQITLKNFSIDFTRSFHSEGEILAVGDGYMDLHIPEAFPFIINSAGILEFRGIRDYPPGYPINPRLEKRKDAIKAKSYVFKRMLEYDTKTRATAFMKTDIQSGAWLPTEKLEGNRNIRIFHPSLTGTVGNIMTFSAKTREYPGFVVSDSADVTFDNITIHHAGGMGIIGQRCHNVTVQNSKVTPSQGRIISATADATHFNNCTGKIELINNLFENQQDDATNIHGIYAMFYELLDSHTAYIKTQHPQQWGFDFIQPGDTMELVQGESLITYGTNNVKSAERISKEITKVQFEKEIDTRIKIGDSIAEVRQYPDVLIKGNIIRRNRARGMLLNCRGKTIVEDNLFQAPGAAILFEGDARNWYEQGGVRDVLIRNNTFDNSRYSSWGKAVIAVDAGIDDEFKDVARYNRNIRVENNVFNVFDTGLLLDLFSVDSVTFKNNQINKTDAFPERKHKTPKFFRVSNSDNVVIENNEFNGFE